MTYGSGGRGLRALVVCVGAILSVVAEKAGAQDSAEAAAASPKNDTGSNAGSTAGNNAGSSTELQEVVVSGYRQALHPAPCSTRKCLAKHSVIDFSAIGVKARSGG